MMFYRSAFTACAALFAVGAADALGSDYIDATPATVYERAEMSPQNMDFDKANNMFTAHACWYNDKMVHYYKFRMYTPGTYPNVLTMGSSSDDVPIQKLFIVSTTGDLTGAIGRPIIEYHHVDGVMYSDFMEIQLVAAPDGYVADTYKSVGDIEESGAAVTPTGIIVNLPVVPTDSTLQDPAVKSDVVAEARAKAAVAPISPTEVFYKGQPVWTYVFEVTDEAAATHFANTRADPSNPDYAITVTPFATASSVNAIPLWHLNQYTAGVDETNFGGPSDMGMRNVISLDRPDSGYSPLWAIEWVTELPINYMADDASNILTMTPSNGFKFVPTPMFVNCPDIGSVGPENLKAKDSFQTVLDASLPSNTILGSDMSIIMEANVPITFQTAASNEEIGETMTNMMGAYEYELMSTDIPEGTAEIAVVGKEDMKIRTIAVSGISQGTTNNAPTSGGTMTMLSAAAASTAALLLAMVVVA